MNTDSLGLGGVDGAVAIDMVNMQHFSMDNSTWQATIGAGTLLGQISERLHNAGGRAMAHGVCPAIGIGGHATIVGSTPYSPAPTSTDIFRGDSAPTRVCGERPWTT